MSGDRPLYVDNDIAACALADNARTNISCLGKNNRTRHYRTLAPRARHVFIGMYTERAYLSHTPHRNNRAIATGIAIGAAATWRGYQ